MTSTTTVRSFILSLLTSVVLGCSGAAAPPPAGDSKPSANPTGATTEEATPKETTDPATLKAENPPENPPAPKPEEKIEPKPFSKLTPEEEKVIVVPHLKPGEELAHAVFRGPFGPAPDAILVIVTTQNEGRTAFSGFVLVPEPGGHRREPLPAFGDWEAWEVSAILLDNLDEDADREPIIMTSYIAGAGPEAAVPFYSNVVLDWNGSAFVRNAELEKKIETLDSAAKIRAALKK